MGYFAFIPQQRVVPQRAVLPSRQRHQLQQQASCDKVFLRGPSWFTSTVTLTAVPSIAPQGRGRGQRLAHGQRVRLWHPFRHPRIPQAQQSPGKALVYLLARALLSGVLPGCGWASRLDGLGAQFLRSSSSARPLPPAPSGSCLSPACRARVGAPWASRGLWCSLGVPPPDFLTVPTPFSVFLQGLRCP